MSWIGRRPARVGAGKRSGSDRDHNCRWIRSRPIPSHPNILCSAALMPPAIVRFTGERTPVLCDWPSLADTPEWMKQGAQLRCYLPMFVSAPFEHPRLWPWRAHQAYGLVPVQEHGRIVMLSKSFTPTTQCWPDRLPARARSSPCYRSSIVAASWRQWPDGTVERATSYRLHHKSQCFARRLCVLRPGYPLPSIRVHTR
jgi:hypothetical protein